MIAEFLALFQAFAGADAQFALVGEVCALLGVAHAPSDDAHEGLIVIVAHRRIVADWAGLVLDQQEYFDCW